MSTVQVSHASGGPGSRHEPTCPHACLAQVVYEETGSEVQSPGLRLECSCGWQPGDGVVQRTSPMGPREPLGDPPSLPDLGHTEKLETGAGAAPPAATLFSSGS